MSLSLANPIYVGIEA